MPLGTHTELLGDLAFEPVRLDTCGREAAYVSPTCVAHTPSVALPGRASTATSSTPVPRSR